jgi:soluble lytic murein transglycosylase-like protein
MGARRSLLATVFVFGFCFATGCALSRGTPARSFQDTTPLDQTILTDNSAKEPNLPLEEVKVEGLLLEQLPLSEQTLNEQSVLSSAMSSSEEPAKPKPVRNIFQGEKQGPAKKLQEDSPIAFEQAPGPRADDQLLDWVDKDLEKAFELPVEKRRLEFSKAVTEHRRVRYFIEYFSKSQKEHFTTALARSGRYFPMISKVLREEGLPEELTYLALIESNFQTHAVSPSGAVGLWQFVPETARKYGLRINSWVDERRDPLKSTRAAAAYLKDLHGHFGKWYLATAAYNAGQGAIKKALTNSGAKDFWSLSDKTVLKDETRNFVPKFVAAALIATNPQKYGFSAINYDPALEYDEVEVGGNLQLARLAEMTGVEAQTLKQLNPELLQNYTPPGEDRFRVKLPAGTGAIAELLKQEEKQPERQTETAALVVHEVRRGDTLLSIARRYGQEVRMLVELNGLKSSSLRVGQKLKVLLESLRGRLR